MKLNDSTSIEHMKGFFNKRPGFRIQKDSPNIPKIFSQTKDVELKETTLVGSNSCKYVRAHEDSEKYVEHKENLVRVQFDLHDSGFNTNWDFLKSSETDF
jgi:hypothetical protein